MKNTGKKKMGRPKGSRNRNRLPKGVKVAKISVPKRPKFGRGRQTESLEYLEYRGVRGRKPSLPKTVAQKLEILQNNLKTGSQSIQAITEKVFDAVQVVATYRQALASAVEAQKTYAAELRAFQVEMEQAQEATEKASKVTKKKVAKKTDGPKKAKKRGRPKGSKNKPKDGSEQTSEQTSKEPKRKPGRPKGSKNKPKAAETAKISDSKGSKNITKRRGRKKAESPESVIVLRQDRKGSGSEIVMKEERPVVDVGTIPTRDTGLRTEYAPGTEPKSVSIVGYCPECGGTIADSDKESKFIIVCPYCEYRCRTKYLAASPEEARYPRVDPKKEADDIPEDDVEQEESSTESSESSEKVIVKTEDDDGVDEISPEEAIVSELDGLPDDGPEDLEF